MEEGKQKSFQAPPLTGCSCRLQEAQPLTRQSYAENGEEKVLLGASYDNRYFEIPPK